MAALTANRRRHRRNLDGLKLGEFLGVDSDEFYEGGLVSWSAAASTIVPSSDTASERMGGVCTARVTTGSSNALRVKYEYGHEEWFPHTGLAAGDEGKNVFVSDDNTVGDAPAVTNQVSVGELKEFETIEGTAGVWVHIAGFAVASAPAAVTAGNTPLRYYNHDTGAVLASRGTDGVSVDGTIYYGEILVPYAKTITNINVLNGTTVGTDNIIAAIYDPTDGLLLGSSALAGATSAGADAYQQLALTAPLNLDGGRVYLVAIQLNGTTATVQRAATGNAYGVAGSQTGVFGTLATISSVATTFTTAFGPLAFLD